MNMQPLAQNACDGRAKKVVSNFCLAVLAWEEKAYFVYLGSLWLWTVCAVPN